MKKKILAAALILALCPRAFADMDILTESVYDVLADKIKGDAGNLTDPDYLEKLIVSVAEGASDQLVQEIVDNYDPENLKSEIGMKLLEKLVPAAAGPIGLILKASTWAHEGTRSWLDWAKANRMEEFNSQVINRGNTVAELDAAWNNFNSDFIQTGLSDTGVVYAERADLIREMKTAYAMRRKELQLEEDRKNAVKAKVEAKQRAYKYFRWLKKDAQLKAEGVVSMLKITGQPVTRENVRKALKDPAAHNELVKKWWVEVDKAAQAKGEVKLPPSGDPELDKAVAIVSVSRKPVAENTTPDYGPLIQEYGLNSDRLLTSNISSDEYNQVRGALRAAARNMLDQAQAPYYGYTMDKELSARNQKKREEQLAAYNNSFGKADEIDQRLSDYAKDLAKNLEALTMGGPGLYNKPNTPLADFIGELSREFYGSPVGKRLEDANWLVYQVGIQNSYDAHSHWAGVSWSGKESLTLEQMKALRNKFLNAAVTYETLIPQAAEKASRLLTKVQEFENVYNQASGKYADLYQRNSGLTGFSGLPPYDYHAQRKDLEAARAELANPKSFTNSAFLAELRDGARTMRREQAPWDEDIKLNEQFLADFKKAPDAMAALLKGPGGKAPAELTSQNLKKYYDENYADFLWNRLEGALILLDEKTVGMDPGEGKLFAGRYRKVFEIADTPAYAGLTEHNRRLAEFRKKLDELKALDLEGRAAKAEALSAAMALPLSKIKVMSKEAAEAQVAFTELKARLPGGIVSCLGAPDTPCLSYAELEGKYKTYEARIRKAEEVDKKAAAACLRSQADPSYDYRSEALSLLGLKKWMPSEETVRACAAADKARWAETVKEFRKITPFKEVTIAGRQLAGGLELKRGELHGGKAAVRGSLHPDAPAYTHVYVSLNSDYAHREPGQTVPVSGGAFEYSFEPVPGETYYVGVQAINGPEGMVSQPLPSNGHITLTVAAEDQTGAIQAFYDKFKAAYENRNAPAVMALISPDWGAEDVAATDLEENLRANFRLYDEIRFSISGLKVTGKGKTQEACYETAITSRIFKRNLKHEEKSSVCDELKEEGGKLKITRTLSGRYWYVK
ncbi:MAG TPA: hypothetical protein DCS63_04470 [Elusimicrobia bacterium]|nr:hypothetical protein [Elusimicrobiota bacterium]